MSRKFREVFKELFLPKSTKGSHDLIEMEDKSNNQDDLYIDVTQNLTLDS